MPEQYTEQWLCDFSEQLRSLASRYKIALAGGDTTRSKLVTVTVSVHGCAATPLLRSAAKEGDDIWLTGRLGGAAAALPAILANDSRGSNSQWLQAYWQPDIPILFAEQANSLINSAIDLSDGLLGDAEHLAKASQVDLEFNIPALPLADQLRFDDAKHLALALGGGDDYQLCFTADTSQRQAITQLAQTIGQAVSRVGSVVAGNGAVRWYDGDHQINPDSQGYQHF